MWSSFHSTYSPPKSNHTIIKILANSEKNLKGESLRGRVPISCFALVWTFPVAVIVAGLSGKSNEYHNPQKAIYWDNIQSAVLVITMELSR